MIPHKLSTPRVALAVLACSAVTLAWTTGPVPQQGGEVGTQHVAGSVHMLVGGRGGNIALSVGDDGVVMIDDQFDDLAPRIRAAVEALTDAPLRWVINTHHHGDHTGGNPSFGQLAPIVAHSNVRARLLDGQPSDAMLAHGLPIVTYEQGMTVHANDEAVRIVHYPACHTDGDSVVFFDSANVVHMGDMFFSGRFPFVDIDAGGSVSGLIGAVSQILTEIDDETQIVPGHGPLSTKADLAEYLEMLRTTRDRVASVTAEGGTIQDMLRDEVFADYAEWGTGFINTQGWLQTLVREQSGN